MINYKRFNLKPLKINISMACGKPCQEAGRFNYTYFRCL